MLKSILIITDSQCRWKLQFESKVQRLYIKILLTGVNFLLMITNFCQISLPCLSHFIPLIVFFFVANTSRYSICCWTTYPWCFCSIWRHCVYRKRREKKKICWQSIHCQLLSSWSLLTLFHQSQSQHLSIDCSVRGHP
jgi:hypothetical protein